MTVTSQADRRERAIASLRRAEPARVWSESRRHSFARRLVREARAIYAYRGLVRYLVSASLKTENVGTVFGRVWWLLDPLLLAAVYVLLVDVIFNRGGPYYPVFVFGAVLAWKWFASSTETAIAHTVGKEALIKQVAFPRTVIPVAAVVTGTVNFLFGLVVLVSFSTLFGIQPHPMAALALPIAAVQLAFTLGVALLLSSLNVFFRDIKNLVSYGFRFWFYLSPGLYAISLVPERYRDVYELNPFATFFPAYRDVLMYHRVPDLMALGIVSAVSLGVLAVGFAVFVRLQSTFAKVM